MSLTLDDGVSCQSAPMSCFRDLLTAYADIDSNNLVRQRSGNNRTVGWSEDSLSKAKLTVWDGDLVGLSACESAAHQSAPIRVFYAFNSTAFEENLWRADQDGWEWQRTWEGYSAAADVGCYTGSDQRCTQSINSSSEASNCLIGIKFEAWIDC